MEAIKTDYRHLCVFKIDNDLEVVEKVNIDTEDFRKYGSKLVTQFLNADNKREFYFKSNTTEVANIILNLATEHNNEFLEAIFNEKTIIIANRLLKVQVENAKKHPNTRSPKEGGLVVIATKLGNKLEFLISKIDQAVFIDLVDSKFRTGLPDDKATQKTCNISYEISEEEMKLTDIQVSDTNATISKFWCREFLELTESRSDIKNTDTAYHQIKFELNKVRKKSRGDYTEFSNRLNGYFSTQKFYNHENMIEYVIGDYQPINEEINIQNLKKRLTDLPKRSNKSFDFTFNMDIKNVKKSFKQTYQITERITLTTTSYISDLKKQIVSSENEEGEKILEIRNISDQVYNAFKTKD